MVIHLTQRADTADMAQVFDSAALTGHIEMAGLVVAFITLYPFATALVGLGLAPRIERMDVLKVACYGLVAVGVVGLGNLLYALFVPRVGLRTAPHPQQHRVGGWLNLPVDPRVQHVPGPQGAHTGRRHLGSRGRNLTTCDPGAGIGPGGCPFTTTEVLPAAQAEAGAVMPNGWAALRAKEMRGPRVVRGQSGRPRGRRGPRGHHQGAGASRSGTRSTEHKVELAFGAMPEKALFLALQGTLRRRDRRRPLCARHSPDLRALSPVSHRSI